MAHEYRPPPMSLAQRAALRQQEPRALRQPARRRLLPLIILLVLLALVVVAAGGFEYLYRGRIYPKVQLYAGAMSINVGGQTQDAALQTLYPYQVQQLFRPIVLTAPGQAPIRFPAFQLGYSLDRGQTVARAYSVGRDGSLVHRVSSQLKLLVNGEQVPIVQHLNRSVLVGRLFKLAAQVDRPARPGVRGRRLNVGLAARRIAHDLLTVQGGFTVPLPFIGIRALPAPPPVHHKTRSAPAKKRGAKKH